MSRTYRALSPSYRPGFAKWYPHIWKPTERHLGKLLFERRIPFKQGAYDPELTQRLYRQHGQIAFLSKEYEANSLHHTLEDLHHDIFRNGSCRRQRINGARETKRLIRREARRKADRELIKAVDEYYLCGNLDYDQV